MHKWTRHWRLNHVHVLNALYHRPEYNYAYNPYFTVDMKSEAVWILFTHLFGSYLYLRTMGNIDPTVANCFRSLDLYLCIYSMCFTSSAQDKTLLSILLINGNFHQVLSGQLGIDSFAESLCISPHWGKTTHTLLLNSLSSTEKDLRETKLFNIRRFLSFPHVAVTYWERLHVD